MPLRTKGTNVTFDQIKLVATASLRRLFTRTVIEVLALVTGDASRLHIDSKADVARRDTNDTQAVGARTFVFTVFGTQLLSPGMKIIGQDLCFNGTIAVLDKSTTTVTVKKKQKKYAVVTFDHPQPRAGRGDL